MSANFNGVRAPKYVHTWHTGMCSHHAHEPTFVSPATQAANGRFGHHNQVSHRAALTQLQTKAKENAFQKLFKDHCSYTRLTTHYCLASHICGRYKLLVKQMLLYFTPLNAALTMFRFSIIIISFNLPVI